LIFVIALLSLTGLITAIFVMSTNVQEVRGWYNSSWANRRTLTVSGTGSDLTNEDVLVVVNTSTLISSGKLQSNCNDLRFVDSNDTTLLAYWIEGGCNTTTTQVWVRIPSLPAAGKTIYLYYSNPSATSGQASWSGKFLVLSSASCPSGWTRESVYDGKFPYGSSSYGTSSNGTHNHGTASCTTGTAIGTFHNGADDDSPNTTAQLANHTHTGATVNVTDTTIDPPFTQLYYCSNTSLSHPANTIAMFNTNSTTLAANFTYYSTLTGRYPKGGNGFVASGGSATHTHSATGGYNTGTNNSRDSKDAHSSTSAAANHFHTTNSTTTTAGNNNIPYYSVTYGQASTLTYASNGIIEMTTALPPYGWTRFSALDGKFPLGAVTAGSSYAGATHTHSISVTTGGQSASSQGIYRVSGSAFVHDTHTHSCTATTSAVQALPPYITTIFAQRKASVNVSQSAEETYNAPPTAPTSLTTNDATNPTRVTTMNPIFSAIFNDPDTGDTGVSYQLQVNTTSAFNGTTMWDSGKINISAVTRGTRGPNITYGQSNLTLNGVTYYWRIKYWDNKGAEGAWSSAASFRMNTPASAPTQLQTEGLVNPTSITNTQPNFSALFTDPDGDSGNKYQIQVNTNSSFTGTTMWDSGETSMATTANNTRTPNITYQGNTLTLDGTTYYWRMRVWDVNGSVSGWSSTNTFKMNSTPNAPSSLETNNQTNPTQVTTLQPQFSAVFTDSDPSDLGTHYQVQVNTNSSFTGTTMWDSGYIALLGSDRIENGLRSIPIQYEGVALSLNGVTYFWRIRFIDTPGTESPWSSTATFKMLDVPNTVTEFKGTPLTTTSMRWEFVDNASGEEGIMLYDENDILKVTCVGQNLTYCDEENLSENTQYTRYAIVFNNEAESSPSNSASAYTLVSVPTIQYSGVKTDTSISLTATQPVNGGELYFDCEGSCDTNINVWTLDNNPTVTGLSNNTPYTFKVKARNGDNVETEYSDTITIYTQASVPTLSAGPLSTTSVSLNATGVNNLSTGDSGLFFECIETGCDSGIREWIKSTSDVAIGLQPNTQYTFRVKARNFDGQETLYSTQISTYTLATTPSLTDVYATSNSTISLRVLNGANPEYTELLIQETFTGKYLNLTTGELQATPFWGENNADLTPFSVIGLNSGTTYTFKVKARNGENVETDFSGTSSATTLLSPITAIAPVVDSSSQITWRISEYTDSILGIKLYNENGVLIKTCLGTEILSCTENNLQPNTSYSRKMKIYNSIAESTFSNVVSAITFANVPSLQNITAGKYTADSVDLTVNTNNNPSTTRYLLQEKISGKYLNTNSQLLQDSPYYATYIQLGSNNGITVYGLLPNTEYTFRVKALNDDSIETEYGNEVSIITLSYQPAITSVTAIDTTTMSVVINANSNNTSTTYRLMEVNRNQNVNPSTRVFDTQPVWRSLQDFGSNSGVNIQNLEANTRYTFCVRARNSQNLETDCSQSISAHTFSRVPSVRARVISGSSIELTVDKNLNPANTRYQLVEAVTNGNIDNENRFTTATVIHDDTRVNSNFTLANLPPNTTYTFRVRSVNSDNLFSGFSETISATTWANLPRDLIFETVGGSTGRIRFDRNGNPTTTRFAIQESNTGKYLDYTTMQLVDNVVWGTHSSWGGNTGLTIRSLEPGAQYAFRVKAINNANVETAFVESNTGKTFSIILNKPENISTILVDNRNIDVSNVEGAQTGVQTVRILTEDFVVADLPISFENNRDWSNAIIQTSPQQGKTVVKLNTTHGLTDKYTMYVVKKDSDNAFRICPEARSLEEIKVDCNKAVLYTGNFPQKLKVEGNDVTVSQASISGVTYWIADGLRGTGAQGELYEKPAVIPTTGRIRDNISNAVEGVVTTTFNLLDSSPLGNIEKERLTTVSATATAVTVSVGLASILGNLGQVGYAMSQIFINILSSIGFRRKRYPAGYVYDSITRAPIQQAIVRIYDLEKKLVDTAVTDGYGLFRTDIPTGEYILEVKGRNYDFPSKLILGKEDYPLSNVYHGEKILLKENEINVVIPIDPDQKAIQKKAFTLFRSFASSILPIINLILFLGGITIASYVYSKNPITQNLAILLLYIPTTYVLVKSIIGMRRKTGKVLYENGTPAVNIILILKDKDFDKVVAKRVTDSEGRYSFDISEKGEYIIETTDSGIKIVEGKTEISTKGRKLINRNLKIART